MAGERNVLLVDDDKEFATILGMEIERAGFRVTFAASGAELIQRIENGFEGAVLLDVQLPDSNGMELLEKITRFNPENKVVIVTAFGSIGMAMTALTEKGAFYVYSKIDGDFLKKIPVTLNNAFKEMELGQRIRKLELSLHENRAAARIVTGSQAMLQILDKINQVADSKISVLIAGESGTGKELVARAIHESSSRAEQPFVAVNCAGIPETLLESELFGYERGAFTGAYARKKGRFELADGGTLLLDEIGDMGPALQVKLLRVLQEQEFERLGGTEHIRVDVRIISATNRDLTREVEAGRFREDLYYRLAVFPMKLPPLRERSEDILLLAEFFRRKYSAQENKETKGFTLEAKRALQACAFPGNVRQLENAIAHGVVVCQAGQFIDVPDLPPTLQPQVSERQISGPIVSKLNRMIKTTSDLPTIAELEELLFTKALELHSGKVAEAAKSLGVDRTTLYRRLKGTRPGDENE